MVSAAASLHGDQAGRLLRQRGGELAARDRSVEQDIALGIEGAELEGVLCQVDGDDPSIHGGRLLIRD